MPAVAVIPALIAYIKVVARSWISTGRGGSFPTALPHLPVFLTDLAECSSPSVLRYRQVYFEKISVLKAGYKLEYLCME